MTLKIGQIGTGHAHAEGKMEALRRRTDHFEVVGVVEPDEALRNAAASRDAYQNARWMTEAELFDTPGLQAVAVETAVPDLLPTAARCIDAGFHIHLDKAPGEHLSPVRDLLRTASSKGLVVQMGYMLRYNSAFQFLFRALDEGWLGDVFEVHGVMSKVGDAAMLDFVASFTGGSMFELGCHLIDPLVALLGTPDKVVPFIQRSRPGGPADNTLAVFEYPRATVTVRSSLIDVGGFARRQFVVCGDRGTIEIRPLEPPVLRMALALPCGAYAAGWQDVELPPMTGRYDDQLVDLARVVQRRQGETTTRLRTPSPCMMRYCGPAGFRWIDPVRTHRKGDAPCVVDGGPRQRPHRAVRREPKARDLLHALYGASYTSPGQGPCHRHARRALGICRQWAGALKGPPHSSPGP